MYVSRCLDPRIKAQPACCNLITDKGQKLNSDLLGQKRIYQLLKLGSGSFRYGLIQVFK
jgi:hypothetical protein